MVHQLKIITVTDYLTFAYENVLVQTSTMINLNLIVTDDF